MIRSLDMLFFAVPFFPFMSTIAGPVLKSLPNCLSLYQCTHYKRVRGKLSWDRFDFTCFAALSGWPFLTARRKRSGRGLSSKSQAVTSNTSNPLPFSPISFDGTARQGCLVGCRISWLQKSEHIGFQNMKTRKAILI